MKRALLQTLILGSILLPLQLQGRTPSVPGATLGFLEPVNGESVESPVTLVFELQGMAVAPAGSEQPASGHHHLLIDLQQLPPFDQPIPSDENHRHFGAGQTEVQIELPPGEHSLQLLLGDKDHIPHDPPVVSRRIKIRVE